jgi:pimeloyl-ACP methyl ester carboxylesterase
MTVTLHEWTSADKEALIALCNAVDRTFLSDRLPYPYTEADADWWLEMVTENAGKEGVWRSIRAKGQLVGSISVERMDGGGQAIGEIGYMILTSCWSQSIGTEAVRQICEIAFQELALDQIIGQVFPENVASARVLEKNGFRLEETKTGAVVKGGKAMDVRVYQKSKAVLDITHHYIEIGTGFPLILLHGNGEESSYFVHQIEAFSTHFRVIALDTRGHGQTPRGNAPFTIRQFAEDLIGFMDRHNIEKAHILGFSDGGNIALVFAMAHPERVEKLILNGANLDASGVKRSTQIPIEIGYRIAKHFARKSPEARKNAELLGLMVNDPNVRPEELSRIQAPTLVIAGSKDMIKESHTRLIAQSIPWAELVLIPGNHFVANKNPEAFNEAVMRFLNPMK